MSDRPRRTPARLARVLGAVLLLGAATGCSVLGGNAGGAVQASSIRGTEHVLKSSFDSVYYEHTMAAETSFFLTDIPIDALVNGMAETGQVLHVDLLWTPRPGATPMDSTATNLSLRLLILSNGEAGLYEGGGFGTVTGNVGDGKATLNMRDSTLRLTAATDGFVDLLTPARIAGRFTAELSPEQSRTIRLTASQIVTNRLGRSAFVDARKTTPAASNDTAG